MEAHFHPIAGLVDRFIRSTGPVSRHAGHSGFCRASGSTPRGGSHGAFASPPVDRGLLGLAWRCPSLDRRPLGTSSRAWLCLGARSLGRRERRTNVLRWSLAVGRAGGSVASLSATAAPHQPGGDRSRAAPTHRGSPPGHAVRGRRLVGGVLALERPPARLGRGTLVSAPRGTRLGSTSLGSSFGRQMGTATRALAPGGASPRRSTEALTSGLRAEFVNLQAIGK